MINLDQKMDAKPVGNSIVRTTQLVLPSHTNALGTIFGGVIMSWIDIAAAISAQRHSGRSVVTASIDTLNFVASAQKGWVVNLLASVNFVSRTSMEVGVRVDAESPLEERCFHIASCYLTFVALGNDGKPISVRPLICETPDEFRRQKEAQIRRSHRLELIKQIKK